MISICIFNGNMNRGGGTEKMTQVLANELVKEVGYSVHVLSMIPCCEPKYKLDDRVRFHSFQRTSGKIGMLKIIIYLYRYIKNNNIDVIINVDIILSIYTLPLKCLLRNLKVISWEQFNVRNDLGISWSRYLRQFCLSYSDYYVCLTKKDLETYFNEFKVKCLITNVYNTFDENLIDVKYNIDSNIIVTAGNFYYTKGFDLAVEVAKCCLLNHSDWKWKFYGDGVEFNKVRDQIERYGLQNKVILAGRSECMRDVYSEAGIYVMTSRLEGFGLVLLEAKACGIPVVAFDCPCGPAEIIENGENGILIQNFDIRSMAESITQLIENKDMRMNFSKSAKEHLSAYSSENFRNQWLGILKSI